MLIFIAKRYNGYTITEQASIAIKAGCGWIQASLAGLSHEEAHTAMAEVVGMCREQGVILTIEDDTALATELGVHGVYLTDASANARAMRTQMGAEAIIGIAAASPSSVGTLAALDMDYVFLPAGTDAQNATAFMATVRASGAEIPVVSAGCDPADIPALLAAGVSGFALSLEDIKPEGDPAKAVSEILTTISLCAGK